MVVDFRLYLITDRKVSTKPLPEAVRLALEGGVRAVQLREKDLQVRELLALAKELRGITKDFGAKLFINDRVDVAVAVHADGVHLGVRSMPPQAVRKVVSDKMLIGVSTHNREEAWSAETEGADFITFGPIYATPSKNVYGEPVGLNVLNSLIKYITIPIYAIGGIKSGNTYDILQQGAYGVSMISGILSAPDIRKAAKETIGMIQRTLAGERP